MFHLVIAQSLVEYGSLASFSTAIHQRWSQVLILASNLDHRTWVVVAGGALLVIFFWRRRWSRF